MTRLLRHSKHGRSWYLTYSGMAHRNNVGCPNMPSPHTSSTSFSTYGTCSPRPPSSPWAFSVEWFDEEGNSLGFAPGAISDILSSSRTSGIPSTPRVVPPPFPQHHNWNSCEYWSRLLASVEVMRGLLIDMRLYMDDLRFRLEIEDRRGEHLETLLTTLLRLGSSPISFLHTPAPAQTARDNAPATWGMDSTSHWQDMEHEPHLSS